MLEFVLLVGMQHLDLAPATIEAGQTVSVQVVGASDEPLIGVWVEHIRPDGDRLRLGATDAEGSLEFVASDPGSNELRAIIPAVPGGDLVLSRPFAVAPRPRRWLYALACVPLGLALLWWNLRSRIRPPSRRAS